MPIIVVNPAPNAPFGPGYQVTVSTDTIGPFLDPRWRINFFAADNETPLAAMPDITVTDPHEPLTFRYLENELLQPFPHPKYQDGLGAQLQISLLASGVATESITVPVTIESQTGWQWRQDQHLEQGVTGGFTETDRETIQTTQQATIQAFGDVPGAINVGVNALLPHPPLGFMKMSILPIIGSGDGELPGDANLFPTIYGVWWEFTTIPPGIGFLEGPTRHYTERMIQLRAIYTVNGVELVREVVDADYDRVIWLWSEPKPTRIEFSILPGVVAQFGQLVAINL